MIHGSVRTTMWEPMWNYRHGYIGRGDAVIEVAIPKGFV